MSNYRNSQIEKYARLFGALSNPNRLQLFLRLAACCKPGSACSTESGSGNCVGEIGKGLGLAPSTVSHHLKELRQSGLIRMDKRGQKTECWIDARLLDELSDFFANEGGVTAK